MIKLENFPKSKEWPNLNFTNIFLVTNTSINKQLPLELLCNNFCRVYFTYLENICFVQYILVPIGKYWIQVPREKTIIQFVFLQ